MHGLDRELQRLYDEGAPKQVTDAAAEAIRCKRMGLTPPTHLGNVLMHYAANRATQNRYGK